MKVITTRSSRSQLTRVIIPARTEVVIRYRHDRQESHTVVDFGFRASVFAIPVNSPLIELIAGQRVEMQTILSDGPPDAGYAVSTASLAARDGSDFLTPLPNPCQAVFSSLWPFSAVVITRAPMPLFRDGPGQALSRRLNHNQRARLARFGVGCPANECFDFQPAM